MEQITTAMSTAFEGLQGDVTGMIVTVLPFALGIVGLGLAIKLGIKQFKSITSKA